MTISNTVTADKFFQKADIEYQHFNSIKEYQDQEEEDTRSINEEEGFYDHSNQD